MLSQSRDCDVDYLNEEFGVEGAIEFGEGQGGLPTCLLTHPQTGMQVVVYLYGATIVQWLKSNGTATFYDGPDHMYLGQGLPLRTGVSVHFPQHREGALPFHGFADSMMWEVVGAGFDSEEMMDEYLAYIENLQLQGIVLPEQLEIIQRGGEEAEKVIAAIEAEQGVFCPNPLLLGDVAPAITLRLRDTPATRKIWPHKFELLYKITLGVLDRLDEGTQNEIMESAGVDKTTVEAMQIQHQYDVMDMMYDNADEQAGAGPQGAGEGAEAEPLAAGSTRQARPAAAAEEEDEAEEYEEGEEDPSSAPAPKRRGRPSASSKAVADAEEEEEEEEGEEAGEPLSREELLERGLIVSRSGRRTREKDTVGPEGFMPPVQLKQEFWVRNLDKPGGRPMSFNLASLARFVTGRQPEAGDWVKVLGLGGTQMFNYTEDPRYPELDLCEEDYVHFRGQHLDATYIGACEATVKLCPGNRTHFEFVRREGFRDMFIEQPGIDADPDFDTVAAIGSGYVASAKTLLPGEQWHAESLIRFHDRYWTPPVFGDDSMPPLPPIPRELLEGEGEDVDGDGEDAYDGIPSDPNAAGPDAEVRANARLLARLEGLSPSALRLVDLAALLHDVRDYKYSGSEGATAEAVQAFLSQQGVDPETISSVLYIISRVGFKEELAKGAQAGPGVSKELSLEAAIVQDADRLDAIGAIGIARCFTFGGAKHRVLHDPAVPPREGLSKEQYVDSEAKPTTINHFYEKLLKLKGLMKTAAGQQIAAQRHGFMESFLEQFHAEWQGSRASPTSRPGVRDGSRTLLHGESIPHIFLALAAEQPEVAETLVDAIARVTINNPPHQEWWDVWAWDSFRSCRAHMYVFDTERYFLTSDVPCDWRLCFLCAEEAAAQQRGLSVSSPWLALVDQAAVQPSPHPAGPSGSGLELVEGMQLGSRSPPLRVTQAYDNTADFWTSGPVTTALWRGGWHSIWAIKLLREDDGLPAWGLYRNQTSKSITNYFGVDWTARDVGSTWELYNVVPGVHDYIVAVEGCTGIDVERLLFITRSGRQYQMGRGWCTNRFREAAPPGGFLAGIRGRQLNVSLWPEYQTPVDFDLEYIYSMRLVWAAPAGSGPPASSLQPTPALPPPDTPACPSARALVSSPLNQMLPECGPSSGRVCPSRQCCGARVFAKAAGGAAYTTCGVGLTPCQVGCVEGYGLCGATPDTPLVMWTRSPPPLGDGAPTATMGPDPASTATTPPPQGGTVVYQMSSVTYTYAQAQGFCRNSTFLGLSWALAEAADALHFTTSLDTRQWGYTNLFNSPFWIVVDQALVDAAPEFACMRAGFAVPRVQDLYAHTVICKADAAQNVSALVPAAATNASNVTAPSRSGSWVTARHRLSWSSRIGDGPFGAACPFQLAISPADAAAAGADSVLSSGALAPVTSIGVGMALMLSNTSDPAEAVSGLILSVSTLDYSSVATTDGAGGVTTAAGAVSSDSRSLELTPGENIVAVSGCAGGFVERLVFHTSRGRLWTTPFSVLSLCSVPFQELAPPGGRLVGMQGHFGAYMESLRLVWGVPVPTAMSSPTPPPGAGVGGPQLDTEAAATGSSTSTSSDDEGGLSSGAIAGIVVGSVCGALLLAAAVAAAVLTAKRRSSAAASGDHDSGDKAKSDRSQAPSNGTDGHGVDPPAAATSPAPAPMPTPAAAAAELPTQGGPEASEPGCKPPSPSRGPAGALAPCSDWQPMPFPLPRSYNCEAQPTPLTTDGALPAGSLSAPEAAATAAAAAAVVLPGLDAGSDDGFGAALASGLPTVGIVLAAGTASLSAPPPVDVSRRPALGKAEPAVPAGARAEPWSSSPGPRSGPGVGPGSGSGPELEAAEGSIAEAGGVAPAAGAGVGVAGGDLRRGSSSRAATNVDARSKSLLLRATPAGATAVSPLRLPLLLPLPPPASADSAGRSESSSGAHPPAGPPAPNGRLLSSLSAMPPHNSTVSGGRDRSISEYSQVSGPVQRTLAACLQSTAAGSLAGAASEAPLSAPGGGAAAASDSRAQGSARGSATAAARAMEVVPLPRSFDESSEHSRSLSADLQLHKNVFIDYSTVLGRGSTGVVYKGILRPADGPEIPVAVKVLTRLSDPKRAGPSTPRRMQRQGSELTEGQAAAGNAQAEALDGAQGGGGGHGSAQQEEDEDAAQDPEVQEHLKMLAQEVHVLSRLDSPNIVKFFGCCLAAREPFLVTELCREPLSKVIHARSKDGSFSYSYGLADVLRISRDIALHPTVVHRDLKPGNVLLSADGTAKVDMSPETFSNDSKITDRADIYSLGVIMCELATRRRPWDNTRSAIIGYLVAIRQLRPKLPEGDDPLCPPPLASLIERCWRANAEERPSGGEIAKRLTLLLTELESNSGESGSGSAAVGGASDAGSGGASGGGGGGRPWRVPYTAGGKLTGAQRNSAAAGAAAPAAGAGAGTGSPAVPAPAAAASPPPAAP
ncbi:hypothetical protein HYH03_011208 [Edaphochlamys debaryana]|uniref:Protein kinase domain-containing protein n=1 Tax=Edaphochlamys debaryana TaxID=47281 RepID=A0A836BWQ9_9CHLO|nr:hypothetical protein HYH03_011208 [Edaphochlamys debaryana]|eukprot:KAG2490408.1 hypothetical protein HYH03_011208 [Edaphochlamys debaryana]